MNLSKISLVKKIVFLTLFISMLSGVFSFISTIMLNKVIDEYDHVAKINLPNAEALGAMSSNFKEAYIHFLEWKHATTNEKRIEMLDEMKKHMEIYEAKDKWYQSIPFVEGEEAVYNEVAKAYNANKNQLKLIIEGKAAMADIEKLRENFDNNLDKLMAFQAKEAKEWTEKADNLAADDIKFQIISSIGVLIFSIFLSLWMSRKISQSLELMVTRVKEASNIVEKLSQQYKANSSNLAQANTEQAASLQETAASIEEMSSMISKTTENAFVSADSSEVTEKGATKGKEVVGVMMNSMNEINQSNNKIIEEISRSNQQMSEIVAVIQEIGSKTKIINDIVFQTKLLSFNASVEAARAGEHGKGFAVVAEEVGNLAEMSGKASQEISQMLDSSIAKVESIAKETKEKVEFIVNEGKRKVQSGVEVSMECNQILTEIVQNVGKVTMLAKEISVASKEQSQGVQEINKAVGQLEMVTQNNSRLSDESARAADELSNQSKNLMNSVVELESIIKGNENNSAQTYNHTTNYSAPIKSEVNAVSTTNFKAEIKKTVTENAKKTKPVQAKIEPRSEVIHKKASEENSIPDRDQGSWTDV